MLHHPGVVVATAVGGLQLRQRILVEPELVTLHPGARQLQLIENAEFHGVFLPLVFARSFLLAGSVPRARLKSSTWQHSKRFRAKWRPVRIKKTRQNEKPISAARKTGLHGGREWLACASPESQALAPASFPPPRRYDH